jgi:hypothetical protein
MQAYPADIKPMAIYRTLTDSGINYGRLSMLSDIREITTLAYSKEKSKLAAYDKVFAKSWMADISLPSHANYLVNFRVSVIDPASGERIETYKSMYTDDRLSPNGWWQQLTEGSESDSVAGPDWELLGIESVTHNHGFGW